jgi:hypothetical protein
MGQKWEATKYLAYFWAAGLMFVALPLFMFSCLYSFLYPILRFSHAPSTDAIGTLQVTPRVCAWA